MNKAKSISITNNNYILFVKNPNLEFCVGKIVIALLPDSDGQVPRLVIKRLERATGEMLKVVDERANPIKYVLVSKSSFDKDPKTGDNYRKIIPIVNESQLVGEIIAVARPVNN